MWKVDESRFLYSLVPGYKIIILIRDKIIHRLPITLNRKHRLIFANIAHSFQFIFGFKRKKMYFKEMFTTPSKQWGYSFKYLYNNGKIIDLDINKEIIYLHFLKYKNDLWQKNNAKLTFDVELLESKNVLINETGFHIVDKE